MKPILPICLAASALTTSPSRADVSDLAAEWSETSNPHGHWSYNAGAIPLPHVTSWQRTLGGWTSAQPGWAFSEDGTNRIPFWFRSNGTENFPHDFIAGDIVVHTTDDTNGAGNGPAILVWTATQAVTVSITGAVWIGRDIGRAADWSVLYNGAVLTSGHLESGDPYSRANPFDLRQGSNGPSALINRHLAAGDTIGLRLQRFGQSGDFIGVRFTVTTGACPADFNADGQVNVQDFLAFLQAFAAADLRADIDGSGQVNVQDFLAFLQLYSAGC
jgi:hypothetical protein